MKAVIIVGKRATASGARHRIIHNKHRVNMTRRARLGMFEAEERTYLGRFTYRSNNGERPTGAFLSKATIKPFSRRQGSSSTSITVTIRSSKQYKLGN